MINIRTLRKIENNGGLTLKNGKIIEYKSGYQVATEGVTTTDITKVRALMLAFNGNCGLWLEDGVCGILTTAAAFLQSVTRSRSVEDANKFLSLNGQTNP